MENAYKMRITCNPYIKEIVYECYENDQFINISDLSDGCNSELINDKFTKTSFQNRAYEIVELLNKHFNPGNKGLHIDFIGNKDDYDVLESVIATYFSDCNITSEKNSFCILIQFINNTKDFFISCNKAFFFAYYHEL